MKRHRLGWLCTLIYFLLSAIAYSNEPQKDLKQLAAYYKNIKSIKAQIQLTKTSKFLIKPLVSQVQFSWQGQNLTWHILKPVEKKYTVKLEETPQKPFEARDPRGMFTLVQQLLKADYKSLEEHYDIQFANQEISLKARHKEVQFPEIRVQLKPDHHPTTLVLKSKNANTTLRFLTFEVTP